MRFRRSLFLVMNSCQERRLRIWRRGSAKLEWIAWYLEEMDRRVFQRDVSPVGFHARLDMDGWGAGTGKSHSRDLRVVAYIYMYTHSHSSSTNTVQVSICDIPRSTTKISRWFQTLRRRSIAAEISNQISGTGSSSPSACGTPARLPCPRKGPLHDVAQHQSFLGAWSAQLYRLNLVMQVAACSTCNSQESRMWPCGYGKLLNLEVCDVISEQNIRVSGRKGRMWKLWGRWKRSKFKSGRPRFNFSSSMLCTVVFSTARPHIVLITMFVILTFLDLTTIRSETPVSSVIVTTRRDPCTLVEAEDYSKNCSASMYESISLCMRFR